MTMSRRFRSEMEAERPIGEETTGEGLPATGSQPVSLGGNERQHMAGPTELPQLISEFFDLAKEYLREHTVVPAKRLGRLAGFSFAASTLFVLAALFLGIVIMRLIVEAMPDGNVWSGFGYVLSAVALLAVTGLVMWRATR